MDASSPVIHVERYGETGCLFCVRAAPGAKRNAVSGVHQQALKVSVTQVAEGGKANQQILKVLADFLQIRRSQLDLVAGQTSRDKKVACNSLTPEQLLQKLKLFE